MTPRNSLTSRWILTGRIAVDAGMTDGWVLVSGERIEAVGAGRPPQGPPVVEAGGVVSPGFVDVHVHGAAGSQVGGGSPEEVADAVEALAAHHLRHGTTALVPASVSDTLERLEVAARGVALARRRSGPGRPTVLGLNLEGPWLSHARRGAHNPDRLRAPDPDELHRLVEAGGGAVRMVTVAPELPGALRLIAAGRAAGLRMSVGHTDADFDAARAGFGAGATHVTHLGNAMRPVDRRAPGPVAAAIAEPYVTLEVIADGLHLHPGFLAMVATAAPERLVAVTDAVGCCGMPPGRYHLGPNEVVLEEGRVALADAPDTLAGSVLTMDRAVATLVDAGVGLADALRAATATPAAVAGAPGKGRLVAGADADLVVLDDRLEAAATVAGGVVAWDRDGRLAGLPGGGDERR